MAIVAITAIALKKQDPIAAIANPLNNIERETANKIILSLQ